MKNFFYFTVGTYFLFKVIGILIQVGMTISLALQYGNIQEIIMKMLGV